MKYDWKSYDHGSGGWAIVKSGSSHKIIHEKLTDYDSYEWDEFKTLKRDDNIMWFNKEADAIAFILDHFKPEEIDPRILPLNERRDGTVYHW